MKKIFLLITALVLTLTACTTNTETLKIGVNFYPMPELVDLITDDLLKDGIEVSQVQMDYNLLNKPLLNNEIDGNLIQHQYFMEFFNQANKGDLVIATPVYHSKFALFSAKYDSLDSIPQNETVILPEDIVNLPRALILLESIGLITLNPDVIKTKATLNDITSNPKNLEFKLMGLATGALAYKDANRSLAVLYPSYAYAAIGLIDDSEYLANEELNDLTKTYAISFVVRSQMLNDSRIKTFMNHLTSDKVRNWITTNYGWAAVPAF